MKIDGENIFLDINTTENNLAEKILVMKKSMAAVEYTQKYRKAANESNKTNTATTALKLLPALILLLIAAIELIGNIVPGVSWMYSLLAVLYFVFVLIQMDKINRKKKFRNLCEESYLIEETNEMDRAKIKSFDQYLIERDKKLQDILRPETQSELNIKSPYNQLVDVDENSELVVALPIAYDTETRELQYNLYNETDTCFIPEEEIISNLISDASETYLYIDLIRSKAGLFSNI